MKCVDLNNKLKGLPTIYYVNLDNRIDRREWMESQFDHWKIKNFLRVSGTKYLASRHDEWKDKYIGEGHCFGQIQHTANAISHLEMIKNWLETTNDKYLLIFEDDADLSLIKYWNFDWEYLMNNIPYDWDCIQFAYLSKKRQVYFFLHPKPYFATYYGPCMINRHYAEKLIRLHYTNDNKINLTMKTNNNIFIREGNKLTVDYFICGNGKTYCIPLLSSNVNFLSYEGYVENTGLIEHATPLIMAFNDWWQNDHHKFSLEEFFTYGKRNDWQMTKDLINYKDTKNAKFNYN